MNADPEAARRDRGIIHATIVRLHEWFRHTIPFDQLTMVETHGRVQPPGFGQLCGCSTQLLSPELYRDFVAPLDDAVLALYPEGGMIHLCGAHAQHLLAWRGMRSLRALQINDRAATDFEVYWSGLRDDQVTYVAADDGLARTDKLRVTRGRRLVLVER
ncbi:MAG: hypothetical protein E4H17_01550 [Gemmatimonadales bacterium]|nr:MAG: hypothetical protein E4H17_01550 [Gemmatimonadales bacterium]